jgi:hypothetical protein
MSLPPYSAGFVNDVRRLEQWCLDDGLLARGLGGTLRITRKGREVVKSAARYDQEVAEALQGAPSLTAAV